MKKALASFLLTAAPVLWADSLPESMIRITTREIPPAPAATLPKSKTAWLTGDGRVRIEFPAEPAKTGFWVSILNYPDKWYVNEALGEGEYWKEDGDRLDYCPLGYASLKEMSYGQELEFMQQHGFINRPAEIDGVLCEVWDAFVPGYLATLYINHETGKPFQLEARCDAPSNKLLKKIRYEEYETGIPFDAARFSLPTNIIWTSSNTPPVVLTEKTNFLNWARTYYKNPSPDQVGDALAYINYYKYDMWSSVSMLSILFRDNPARVPGWVQQSAPLRETTRHACLYALWLADSEWGNAFLQTIANDSSHRDNKYVAETLLARNRYAITDLDINSEAIANMHMHAFYMTGDPKYIHRLIYSMLNFTKSKTSKEYAAAKQAVALLAVEAKENPDVSRILQQNDAELPDQLVAIKDALIGVLDQQYDARPIPTNSLLSAAAFEAEEAAFWKQTLSGLLSAEEKTALGDLFDAYCTWLAKGLFTGYSGEPEVARQLTEDLKTKLDAGETNAFVQFAYAELCTQHRARNEAVLPLLEASFDQLRDTPGAASLPAFICADRVLGHVTDNYAKEQAEPAVRWYTNTMSSLLYMLQEGGFTGSARRIAYKYIDNSFAASISKQDVLPWYKRLLETEDADPWLKEMVAGQLKIRAAWNARGGGLADTVTRDMWAEFKGGLWDARRHLEKACELEPGLPETPAEMITVCMGESKKKELRKWFDQSVQQQFDYFPAYSKYNFSIFPRWHGSHPMMFRFGEECLQTRRFDSAIPQIYIAVLNDIRRETDDFRSLFYTYTNLYPQVLDFFENTPPNPALRFSNPFWLGVFAWGARDYQTAQDAFARSGYEREERMLDDFGGRASVMGEIRLGISPMGAKADQARALIAREEFEAAASLYQEILTDPQLDTEYAKPFVLGLLEKSRIQAGLQSGDWFRFMPPDDMSGWMPEGSRWKYSADGWLLGAATSRYARIFCAEPVGDNFELTGEMSAEEAPRLGILFGYSDTQREQYSSFRINPPNAGLFTKIEEKGKRYVTDVSVQGTNTFRIQVWNKKVTVYLNDKLIFRDEPVQEYGWGLGAGRIGLGDYFYSPEGKVMRYRNLQLRRLKSPLAGVENLSPAEFPTLPE